VSAHAEENVFRSRNVVFKHIVGKDKQRPRRLGTEDAEVRTTIIAYSENCSAAGVLARADEGKTPNLMSV